MHYVPTLSRLYFFACGASFSEKSRSFFALFPILPHLSFLSATGAVWWSVVVRWSRSCSSSSKRRPAISQWPASPKIHSLNEAMTLYRFCLMFRYAGHVFFISSPDVWWRCRCWCVCGCSGCLAGGSGEVYADALGVGLGAECQCVGC